MWDTFSPTEREKLSARVARYAADEHGSAQTFLRFDPCESMLIRGLAFFAPSGTTGRYLPSLPGLGAHALGPDPRNLASRLKDPLDQIHSHDTLAIEASARWRERKAAS